MTAPLRTRYYEEWHDSVSIRCLCHTEQMHPTWKQRWLSLHIKSPLKPRIAIHQNPSNPTQRSHPPGVSWLKHPRYRSSAYLAANGVLQDIRPRRLSPPAGETVGRRSVRAPAARMIFATGATRLTQRRPTLATAQTTWSCPLPRPPPRPTLWPGFRTWPPLIVALRRSPYWPIAPVTSSCKRSGKRSYSSCYASPVAGRCWTPPAGPPARPYHGERTTPGGRTSCRRFTSPSWPSRKRSCYSRWSAPARWADERRQRARKRQEQTPRMCTVGTRQTSGVGRLDRRHWRHCIGKRVASVGLMAVIDVIDGRQAGRRHSFAESPRCKSPRHAGWRTWWSREGGKRRGGERGHRTSTKMKRNALPDTVSCPATAPAPSSSHPWRRCCHCTAAGTATNLPAGYEMTLATSATSPATPGSCRLPHCRGAGHRCRPEAQNGASWHDRPPAAATVPDLSPMRPTRCTHPATGRRCGTPFAWPYLATAAIAPAVWWGHRRGATGGAGRDGKKKRKLTRWEGRGGTAVGGKASVAEMLAKPATPPVSPPLDGAGTSVGAMLAPLGRAQTMLRCKCWATFHGFRVLSMRRHPRQFSVDRPTPTGLAATAAVGRRQRHPSHHCLCASGRFAPQPPTWRLDAEPLFLFAFRAAGLCCLVWSTGVAPSTSGL